MAMVGLFWIGEDCVYVGAEPVGKASGVRLTEDGVETVGTDPAMSWTWDEVRKIEAHDVSVRSAARRRVSLTFQAALVAVTGDGELPPEFTVRVESAVADAVEVNVISAAVGGIYTPVEYELSRRLLARLADDGPSAVADLLEWGRDHAADGTPSREEREVLLLKWAGDRSPNASPS